MSAAAPASAAARPTAVLIAGVGNIFAGDDAFGVEVARRLERRALPSGARVVDFGIRAVDLAYALQDECDAVVLVDATARGGTPGTIYVIEPDGGADRGTEAADTLPLMHALNPQAVLRLLAAAPTRCRRAVIVGCEPQTVGEEDEVTVGLSAPVAQAVERAADVVEQIVVKMLGEN
ncbi:MAG TPA: hydrogenase maturation protease [Steroidobacteraceae bacterium]|jgi:hydrogenase maturation protease|nr:hydrogenase maturation protease [Steroidobacteraceae bacterium]